MPPTPLQAEMDPNWEGTAEDLVREVSRLVGQPVPDKEFAPNVRLLRYYQSAGAVSRPERRGKEAYYGYRHLLEVLVVRALVLDGWPVEKIARITSTATNDELRAMLPLVPGPTSSPFKQAEMNKAQALVAQFAREAGADAALAVGSRLVRSHPGRDDSHRLAGWREVVELPLPYDARLSIESTALRSLTPKHIRELAEAAERSLRRAQKLQQQSKR